MGKQGNKPWGKVRLGKTYGENYLRYNRICLWCGITYPTSRPDSKTHAPRCRVALARYVKRHGKPPMFPFGLKPDPKPARKKADPSAATTPTKKGQR